MSMNNPLYILKIDKLLSELRSMMATQKHVPTKYSKALAKHAARHKSLHLDTIRIMECYYLLKDELIGSVNLPIAVYLETKSALADIYVKLQKTDGIASSNAKEFFNQHVKNLYNLATANREEFWDENTLLTFFVTQCKKLKVMPMGDIEEGLIQLLRLKQLAIRKKSLLFEDKKEDLMDYFGDNPIFYDQVDIEKLKIYQYFILDKSNEQLKIDMKVKLRDESNPLRVNTESKEKVLFDFLIYTYSLESTVDYEAILLYILNDDSILGYLLERDVITLRELVYTYLSFRTTEEEESLIIEYFGKKAYQEGKTGSEIINSELSKTQSFIFDDKKKAINAIDEIVDRQRRNDGKISKNN